MPSTRALTLVCVAAACAAVLAVSAEPARAPADSAPYYLALGDSLAAGDQPDSRGVDRPTPEGYVSVLARRLTRVYRGLQAVNLSCGGATSRTLLTFPGCQPRLGPGSQLEEAEHVLAGRPGAALVTIDVGDNDVERCIHTDGRRIDRACVQRGTASLVAHLPAIAQRLRAAAGSRVPVVGITDYDQFLALWLDGGRGRAAARESVAVIDHLNALIASIYARAGILVAPAGQAFATDDLATPRRLPGRGTVPLAVERVCRWTWACSGPPVGHDDHANAAGYGVIAQVVLDALSGSTSRRSSG